MQWKAGGKRALSARNAVRMMSSPLNSSLRALSPVALALSLSLSLARSTDQRIDDCPLSPLSNPCVCVCLGSYMSIYCAYSACMYAACTFVRDTHAHTHTHTHTHTCNTLTTTHNTQQTWMLRSLAERGGASAGEIDAARTPLLIPPISAAAAAAAVERHRFRNLFRFPT